jgi:ABC-type transport system involved in multi-copper enzyme maturation permease subunit
MKDAAAQPTNQPMLTHGSVLWFRQLSAALRIEVGKCLFTKRALLSYILSLMPVLLFVTTAIGTAYGWVSGITSVEQARQIYGEVFSTLILGGVIFLGSAAVFTSLFRGEILDRSMHYYILTPVRREVLVVAKYLAGLSACIILFGLSTLLSFFAMYIAFGTEQLISDLSSGIALRHVSLYLGIVLLACMGYGSVFMTTGLLFRNPFIPIIAIAAWEAIHFILPPSLKIFSVVYYLKGLLPIPLDEGALAVIVAPPPVWVSVFGMLALSVVTVSGSIFLLKRLQVHYSGE